MGLFDFLSGDASVDASVSAGASADASAGGTATAVDGDNITSSGNGGDGSDAAGGGGGNGGDGSPLLISSTQVSYDSNLMPFDTTGSGQRGTVNPWAAPAGGFSPPPPPPPVMGPPPFWMGPPPPSPPPPVVGFIPPPFPIGLQLPPFRRFGGRRQRIKTLGKENMIKSPNGLYGLRMQKDGNLVLFKTLPNQPDVNLWSTNTAGVGGHKDPFMSLGDDGNLTVSRDHFKNILWASQTAGNPGAALYLQDDGNLVLVRRPEAREPRDVLWSSGTIGAPNGMSLDLMGPPMPMPAPGSPFPFQVPEPVYFDMGGHPRAERREERIARMAREDALRRGDRHIPDPIYYDERGKVRAERDNERAARLSREGALRGGMLQHPQNDVRRDERGNVRSSTPVIVNPHRPDPSGGYHHNGIDGTPTPIHPVSIPSHPDPVVIPPSKISNPISPVPVGSGIPGKSRGHGAAPVVPVTTPVVPVATSSGTVSTPVMPTHNIPVIPVGSGTGGTKGGIDSSSGGSLESGAGSTLPETSSGKGATPGGHGGGAHDGGTPTVAGEPFAPGLDFDGFSEGHVLGESEIGGPVLSRRFGVFKPSIA